VSPRRRKQFTRSVGGKQSSSVALHSDSSSVLRQSSRPRAPFYEIYPLVEPFARDYVHYLEHCLGNVEVISGDARLTLDREKPQNFDVLAMDAFSRVAIPIHPPTFEGSGISQRHLAPNGVIATHVSNLHSTLRPVVKADHDAYRMTTAAIESRTRHFARAWIRASRDPQALIVDRIRKATLPPKERRILWTDDRASLFEISLEGIDPWLNPPERK
jgi:spermidine synthase